MSSFKENPEMKNPQTLSYVLVTYHFIVLFYALSRYLKLLRELIYIIH
ncbi:hypothetical protein HNQ92_002401 [Rhabdobacter roseus]|uniref:Uncharacterized protein n=1 Tax=Rhabdobacter roseus TaxID=1655419 RepID=A0A840TVT9_9BACT|nr:hypothetical protein [Rhabdobacter roseus]